ncbi:hypothetical protein [Azohydromonas caseinilytica]|uniref:Uncharacterized protein n=1 Tax=Azohydromonas caseinilytica TaxID=2728836 RepID=A0A848FD44_9BURK|nr:hypothetical protein [Azohydromonas caseinilytica]NML16319.1 hypothetical protein [Azohydromonas caseinilytica]
MDRCLGRGEPKSSGKARSHHGGITIDQIIRISVTIQSQGKITGEANLLAFVAVAITVVVYAFFRQEILLASLVLTSAVIGLWLGVVLNSIYYGYFSGFGWVTYVLLMLLFAAGAIHVIGEAIAPLYAPQYFSSWQDSVHLYGLSVLFQAVGVNGIAWLLTHAAGVALLFYVLWKAMLSMLFYATASSGKREENSFTHSRWIRVAAQNARPM